MWATAIVGVAGVSALLFFAQFAAASPPKTAPAAAPSVTRVFIPAAMTPKPSTPRGEVASALDAAGAVHLVFVQAAGMNAAAGSAGSNVEAGNNGEDLYYCKVAGGAVSALVRVTSLGYGRVRHPYIAVGSDGVVHVAFWVRRKNDAPLRTGNNAVYYARGDVAGFAVEQVSTNAEDPASNALGPYNAYVNDRPRVLFDQGGQPVVVYLSSHFKGPQDYGNYVIVATRTGAGSYVREQAFRTRPDHSVDDGIAAPERWGALRQLAYYDINKYQPHLVTATDGGWSDQVVDGPGGYTNLDEVWLGFGPHGAGHLTWVAKRDKLFLHRRVDGALATEPLDRIPLSRTPWSNFAPTAMDPASERLWFLSEDGTSDDRRHTLVVPRDDGSYREVVIPKAAKQAPGAGVISGHQSFHVRAGRAYLVTGTTDGIMLTTVSP